MLQKNEITINFSGGLDLKSDPNQVSPHRFLSLSNSIFTKAGLLQKRNGFGAIATLPNNSATYLTTFNGGLTAVGTTLESLSSSTDLWTNKGHLQTASLSVLPLYRSSNNQSQCDAATAPNGLACATYTDNPASGTAYYYTILDSTTGQVVVNPVAIANCNASPRVFVLGNYFIVLYGTASNHIQYTAIAWSNPTNTIGPTDITTSYVASPTVNYDGLVYNNQLFIAWNSTSGGQNISVAYITAALETLPIPAKYTGPSDIATMFSLAAETVNNNVHIYVYFYNISTAIGKILIVDQHLNNIVSPTTVITSASIANIAMTAQNGTCIFYSESINSYAYNTSVKTNFIMRNSAQLVVSASSTTISAGTSSVLLKSVGLASKAQLVDGEPYVLTAYQSATLTNGSYTINQPTYFLIDDSANIITKLAYSNGGGLLPSGLPALQATGDTLSTAYLFKDLVSSVNKGTDLSGIPIASVYSQLGVNLASINLSPSTVSSAETGGNINISGGIVWAYDGAKPVEQGFNVWPDTIGLFTATGSGNITAQQYFYQVTYEWADNNGNVFRSAPSIPVTISTSTSSSTNTLYVPNLRLTYKTNVKIVVYRWSAAQQVYYSITSPAAAPVLSNSATDYTVITDTAADSSIIGNPILYTTGGVVENIGAPPSNIMTLFDNRLWALDAEDPNLLWFSKQLIENVPVEMSDVLTIFTAPTTAAQGSTGPVTAMAPMDDKLILFKKDALYYINGIGPDNTGSNNQYSPTTFISSVVGSVIQNSIIFIPNGLMFQSDKGIWLLGRDLSTSYIGAPVESLTLGNTILSAITVPGTNQVRFTMSSGITLMYDYYYNQWGTFTNVPAVSSTVYQGLHTYLNASGKVFQETPGVYLDNTTPTLLSFTTGWVSMAGLQGYERFYQMLLLGQYFTPFKLNVRFAFDYNPNPTEATIMQPRNYSPAWGGNALWGSGSPWGGPAQTFQERVFPNKQKCETFQVIVDEVYDPSLGVQAGQGLSLSGITLTYGIKKGRRTQSAAKSF